MAKDLSEEREALYQMICSLNSEDIHKVVSYVSFLRFVDVYKDKAMADLLRIEITKGNEPKAELHGSFHDTVDTQTLPTLEFSHENEKAPDNEIFFTEEPQPEPAPEPAYDVSVAETSFEAKASFLEEERPARNISAQQLRRIVKNLHLNFTDVAFLFHVSPPVARMRYSGTALFGAEEEMQLQYFLEVAERMEKMSIPRLDQMLKHPMPDGEFFLEKLIDRKITDEDLNTLQKMGEKSEELRRKFKGATKPFHNMQNAIGLYATPLHCEG